MKFSKIRSVSNVNKWAPYSQKHPKYLKWDELIKNFTQQSSCPESMKSGF